MPLPTRPTTRVRLESRQKGGRGSGKEGEDLAGRVLGGRGQCSPPCPLSLLPEPRFFAASWPSAVKLNSQRHKLKAPLTPVTPESFAIWKKTRLEKKQAAADALEKAKSVQRAAGKMTGMTGKDMFEFGGELYEDDEEEGGDDWDISRMLARYVGLSSGLGSAIRRRWDMKTS
jgi:hypothetical protein